MSKLRYVGTTTTTAQLRDGANVVQYNIANSLGGVARFDFNGGGVSQRYYGTNGHHDVTWTANASGAVTATLRYDPWGVGYVTSGSGTDLRFQGSWYDTDTALSWAVNRWYAPDLGTFTSEDSLLGDSSRPATRQLYAYGAGDPVGRADPAGQRYLLTEESTTWADLALHYFGAALLGNDKSGDRLAQSNFTSGANAVLPGRRYRMPPMICDRSGTTCRSYRVFGRDDPIGRDTGYSFGPPYQPSTPQLLAPLPLCKSACWQPNPNHPEVIRSPLGYGAFISLKGWRTTTWGAGMFWEDNTDVFSLGMMYMPVNHQATELRYEHGTLVTVWDAFDVSNEPGGRPTSGNITLSITSGLPWIHHGVRTTKAVVPWFPKMSNPLNLWHFPTDSNHFNAWIPRSWGGLLSYSSEGSIGFESGFIAWNREVVSTTNTRPILNWSGPR